MQPKPRIKESIEAYRQAMHYKSRVVTSSSRSLDVAKDDLKYMIQHKTPYFRRIGGKYSVAAQAALVLIIMEVKKNEIISMTFEEQLTYIYLFGANS